MRAGLLALLLALSFTYGTNCSSMISSCSCTISSSGTYNLTGIISTSSGNCITITAQNVTLNCNGNSATASAGNAVFVSSTRNVTVRNCLLINSNTSIFIDNSSNVTLVNISASNSQQGLQLIDASNVSVLDSSFSECTYNIGTINGTAITHFIHNFTNVSVDGKNASWINNAVGIDLSSLLSSAGFVAIVNSSNVIVSGLDLSANNYYNLIVAYTKNSSFTNINFNPSMYGLHIAASTNINLTNSKFYCNNDLNGGGIYFTSVGTSVNYTYVNNSVLSNLELYSCTYGINFAGGRNNTINNTLISDSVVGIWFVTNSYSNSKDLIVNNATIIGREKSNPASKGLLLEVKSGISITNLVNITNLNVTNHYFGFFLSHASSFFGRSGVISDSYFTNNTYDFYIYPGSASGTIYRVYNNFFSNTNGIYALSGSSTTITFNNSYNCASLSITDGTCRGGNYWKQNADCDDVNNGTKQDQPSLDGLGDGICDSPFNLYGSYYDYLPLVYNYSATDTTPPSVSFESPPTDVDNANVSRDWTYISVLVNDHRLNISACTLEWNGFNYSMELIPGQPKSATCRINKTGLGSGTYLYRVFANDSAGNNGSTETRTINIDTTPPSIELSGPESGSLNSSSIMIFYFMPTDNSNVSMNCTLYVNGTVKGVKEVMWDVGWYGQYFNNIAVSSGIHQWNISCTDLAGNTGYSETRELMIDAAPPVLIIYTPLANASIPHTWTMISVWVTDYPDDYPAYLNHSIDSCILEWDGKNETTMSIDRSGDSAMCWLNKTAPEGMHSFRVFANDSAGNWGSTESRKVVFDTIPPNVSLSNPPDGSFSSTNEMNFQFIAADDKAQWLNCTLYLGGVEYESKEVLNNTPSSFAMILSNGDHDWKILCKDAASNPASSENRTLNVNADPLQVNAAVSVTAGNDSQQGASQAAAALTQFSFATLDFEGSAMSPICSQTVPNMLSTQVSPLLLIASILFAMIIGLTYAAGQAMSNPKLLLWAKTEFVQLFFSAAFMFIMMGIISYFCYFTTADIGALTSVSSQPVSVSIYKGAEDYLKEAANYTRIAVINARYHLGAIEVQQIYSTWTCPIWCFFSTGATGASVSPEAGASYLSPAFTLLLNSSLVSFFSAFMHVFFLNYVGTGLFLFLVPIAIITRSLPYMRSFGSLLLATIFALYVVYPSVLAAYYVALSGQISTEITDLAAAGIPPDESKLQQLELSALSSDWFLGTYELTVGAHAGDIPQAASLSAKAFFYSTFLPTLALLVAAGAAVYVGKLMGEEIDLSRLIQMV